ncbi:MAG: hypothetical protein V1929_01740 [bacterium]
MLIDFVAADLEVLGLIATWNWQFHVAPPVLSEVKALTVTQAQRLGIKICEPTLAELTEAAVRGGALSGRDKLCLAIAKARGWACLTNDQRLRRSCDEAGVQPVWGLEAMVIVHKAGHLSRTRAIKTAQAIGKANPRHITGEILARFITQLDPHHGA